MLKYVDIQCFYQFEDLISCLVVSNIFFYLSHHIGNVIIPTDKVIFFRGVAQPPTRFLLTIINHITTILINHGDGVGQPPTSIPLIIYPII